MSEKKVKRLASKNRHITFYAIKAKGTARTKPKAATPAPVAKKKKTTPSTQNKKVVETKTSSDTPQNEAPPATEKE